MLCSQPDSPLPHCKLAAHDLKKRTKGIYTKLAIKTVTTGSQCGGSVAEAIHKLPLLAVNFYMVTAPTAGKSCQPGCSNEPTCGRGWKQAWITLNESVVKKRGVYPERITEQRNSNAIAWNLIFNPLKRSSLWQLHLKNPKQMPSPHLLTHH